MGIKAKYSETRGFFEEGGSGVEISGPVIINGKQPRSGTNPQTAQPGLVVSGSMGVEVSNNGHFVVHVPGQYDRNDKNDANEDRGPAIWVSAGLSRPRVGIGCEPTFSTLHISASEDSSGVMVDNNPGTVTLWHWRKQKDGGWTGSNSFSYAHDDRAGKIRFYMYGYDGTTYKPFERFDYSDEEICLDYSGSLKGVIIGSTGIDESAKLHVTGSGGFLPPRMTSTERDAVSSPATGLMIYNTTTNKLNVYNGSAWRQVTDSAV